MPYPDDLGGQFLNVGVPAYQLQEGIHVRSVLGHGANGCFQFPDARFKCFLFILVAGCHFGKALIADFSIKIILVEPQHGFCLSPSVRIHPHIVWLRRPHKIAFLRELAFHPSVLPGACLHEAAAQWQTL